MGLMQSLSLVGDLCVSGIMPRLIVKYGHKNDMCYNDIGLCVPNMINYCEFDSEESL